MGTNKLCGRGCNDILLVSDFCTTDDLENEKAVASVLLDVGGG